ncbi:DHHC zinc finger domain containing protein [Tritrichomonas foetus]|uniref:Palmitoyltransferase n=1 Tax=Tritrichomonas foetus TaxID=1144522 RepID=A0A1J4JVT7_9EUKA|nr:DHHC zinc finger domain containing protein [Tritrichomonas foetus]|eukprot:OHT03257.1 DHHC zinc finger domain containing protein [Tritrichomonas foetus]
MNIVPSVFIILHSVLQIAIWILDGSVLNESENFGWRFLSKFWMFLFFYTFALYSCASFMDPGYLKLTWLKEVQNDRSFKEELDDNGERSYCEICNMPRPLRAHHCSVCKKCVLLMDHHCDFIGNCVGYRNYKSFLLFLLEYPLFCITSLVVTSYGLYISKKEVADVFTIVIAFVIYLGLGVIVVSQLIAQVPFALHNKTWIEISGNKIRDELYKRAKIKRENRYDTLSIIGNLKQRLGPNPFLWLIPTPNNGNPYVFPTNPKFIPVHELTFRTINDYGDDDDDETQPLLPNARFRTMNNQL